jgi:hypothetical protein
MEPDRSRWVHADFNGLLAPDLLCIAHGGTTQDRAGRVVPLDEGMMLTAYDDDVDDDGQPDALFASGRVERSPDYAHHAGSQWSLRIDVDGIRHESQLRSNV